MAHRWHYAEQAMRFFFGQRSPKCHTKVHIIPIVNEQVYGKLLKNIKYLILKLTFYIYDLRGLQATKFNINTLL